MSDTVPRLSVIVVTWNAADVIAGCLRTLRHSSVAGGVETIVFDNASSDGTCAIVARDFPAVTLIRNPQNLGFAAANNRAFLGARGPALLLLNPDVRLTDSNAIADMLAVLDADPAVGMVGPRLTFADGRHQVGDAGFSPSPRAMIVHGLGLAHLPGAPRGLYLVRPDRYQGRSVDVDWICGACLLVRRSVVDSVGGLDERWFMYAEDVEWGCRMRGQGHRAVYLPDVRVVHLQGTAEAQAAPGAAPVPVRWLGSLFSLYGLLHGGRWQTTVRAAFVAGFAGRAILYAAAAAARPRHRTAYRRKVGAMAAYARAAARRRT